LRRPTRTRCWPCATASCARICTTGSTSSRWRCRRCAIGRGDLPLLAQAFLAEFADRNNKQAKAVSADTMRRLEQYHWPGNVRELRNVMERATILCEGDFIEPKHLPPLGLAAQVPSGSQVSLEAGITVEEAERRLIILTLEHTNDNKTRAAEFLGISLKTLHNKLNRLGLRKGTS
jgi:DNA-binding NtrC family response regulator